MPLLKRIAIVWPTTLVTCALFNTLHATQYVIPHTATTGLLLNLTHRYAGLGKRGGISRERFFLYAFIGSFCWYFLPGYAFQALSYFSWVCWIVPDNVKVNQMFGVRTCVIFGSRFG